MSQSQTAMDLRTEEWVALYQKNNRDADRWAAGYGAVQHTVETQSRVFSMADLLRLEVWRVTRYRSSTSSTRRTGWPTRLCGSWSTRPTPRMSTWTGVT